MKRVAYAIPLSALALTSLGCDDPVIGKWAATSFKGTPFPEKYKYFPITYKYGFYMRVNEDFEVIFFESTTYDAILTPNFVDSNDVASGTITAVVEKSNYHITLTDGTNLDCSFTSRHSLECTDEEGAEFAIFKPTRKTRPFLPNRL
jgi:hypothetical protein